MATMSRAERRRREKLAGKAARNATAARPAPGEQTRVTPQAIDRAVQHHNAGRLTKAKRSYEKILKNDPNHADALRLLGVIALQEGNNDRAIDLISKSIAINCDDANAYYNLAIALKQSGQLDEAVANYQNALAIKPGYAEAHSNLGNVLKELGRLDEAVASYHKALAIKPDDAGACYNLAIALRELGQLDEAVASYQNALAINPDFAEAHSNLGLALQDMGKLEEAFNCHRRAVALVPQNDLFWAGLAGSLKTLSFNSVDESLWHDLSSLLTRPTVRPSNVVRPIISALKHHPDFARMLERVGTGKLEDGFAYEEVVEQMSAIPIFLGIMGLSPIYDKQVEQMLTRLRRAMIMEFATGKTDEYNLPFGAALALQCFTNEYIYPETEQEKGIVEQLCQRIETWVEKNQDVPPSSIALLGAYRALHRFSWARELGERKWTGDIRQVIERQILEPLQEQSLRGQIPCLTAIEDTVSQSVRAQYEESPYPRWIKFNESDQRGSIGAVLRAAPLRFDLEGYDPPARPEILVAGCGTGQHALSAASRFSGAHVLAVDLSLSSLSYALRKTKQLGFSNIEYAQGDIMELGTIERRFDLIECCGVLHHLGDPLAGWQQLVSLLRPGGLMKIALYSETARQDIVHGRAMITEREYLTSPDGIRQCRQDIVAMAEDGNAEMLKISTSRDFFSLSECRDLIFHVQEHRFTLPQIQSALKDLKLKFLGFEMQDQKAVQAFRGDHPNPRDLASLALWHEFELTNPDTFRGMYQFWCQKI